MKTDIPIPQMILKLFCNCFSVQVKQKNGTKHLTFSYITNGKATVKSDQMICD